MIILPCVKQTWNTRGEILIVWFIYTSWSVIFTTWEILLKTPVWEWTSLNWDFYTVYFTAYWGAWARRSKELNAMREHFVYLFVCLFIHFLPFYCLAFYCLHFRCIFRNINLNENNNLNLTKPTDDMPQHLMKTFPDTAILIDFGDKILAS